MAWMNWTLRLSLVLMPLVMLPSTFRSPAGVKTFVLTLVVIVMAVGCLKIRQFQSLKAVPFWLPLVVFSLICALQTTRSLNPDIGLYFLVLQVCGGFVGLVVALTVERHQVIALVRFMALGSVIVSAIGILEYWGITWAQFPSAGRPSATLGFKNIAAMYLAVGIPLGAVLIFERLPRDRLLGYVAVTMMAVFLIYTRTRGAWVGVFFALVIGCALAGLSNKGLIHILARQVWQQRLAIGGMLVAVMLLAFVPRGFSDQNLSRTDEKKEDLKEAVVSMVEPGGDRRRLDVWYHTFAMIADHPLLGVGMANWAPLYPRYDQGDVLGIVVAPKRPHNDFLWIWAEQGTIGFVVYLWLLGTIFWTMWKTLRADERNSLPVLCAGMGALAVLVHGCFSFPREQAVVLLPLWIALGIAGQLTQDKETKPRLRPIVVTIGVAIGLLGAIMAFRAMRFDYFFTKSLIAQSMGRIDEQITLAQEARKEGVFDHRVLLVEGSGLQKKADGLGTVAVYQIYLQYQPFLPAVHNNLGQAYELISDYNAAESAYTQGLAAFAGDGVYLLQNNLAAVYKKQGRVDDAIALYESMQPKSADAYHNLGVIYTEQRAFAKAKEAYQQALKTDPDMVIALFSLAGVEMLNNELESAAGHYELFLSRWQGVPDYVRDAQLRLRQIYPVLSDQYMRRGMAGQAVKALERLIELDGATAPVYHNLALIYHGSRQLQKAVVAAKRAIALAPDFAPAYFTLGRVYEQSGNIAEAITFYGEFLAGWDKDDALAKQARKRLETLRSQ